MGQSCSPPSQSQSRFPPSICQALALSAAVPLRVQEQSRSLSSQHISDTETKVHYFLSQSWSGMNV